MSIINENKISIIIQARAGSCRFPDKVFKELDNRTLIKHVFDNCRKTGLPTTIAIPFGQRDQFSRFIPSEFLYEGDEFDVLGRIYNCAKYLKVDNVVRITADCPLLVDGIILECVKIFEFENLQYLTTTNLLPNTYKNKDGFPDGFDVEVFTFNKLRDAHSLADNKVDREHVTPWIRRNTKVRIASPGVINLPLDEKYSIDTEEDYNRVRKIILENKLLWSLE